MITFIKRDLDVVGAAYTRSLYQSDTDTQTSKWRVLLRVSSHYLSEYDHDKSLWCIVIIFYEWATISPHYLRDQWLVSVRDDEPFIDVTLSVIFRLRTQNIEVRLYRYFDFKQGLKFFLFFSF